MSTTSVVSAAAPVLAPRTPAPPRGTIALVGSVRHQPGARCTPHQEASLAWLLGQIRQGTPLCSLQGLAGTGKTTLMRPLETILLEAGYHPVLAAPTHRAATILRDKGLDVATIHSRALTAQFTPEYTAACAWFGESVTTEAPTAQPGHGPIPPLLAAQLALLADPRSPQTLVDDADIHGAAAVLASVGIHGRDHITGFVPQPPQSRGVLIVDEASMMGSAILTLCQQVYRQIILVGDPGQLPPVNDEPMLWSVPATQLTEVHRQAGNARLLDLAHRVRHGYAFWKWGLEPFAPDACAVDSAPAEAFLAAPLIVWKNATRLRCTQEIRATLGYPPHQLVPGEPLVCRANTAALREEGFYCNALFRVVKVEADGRTVLLADDATGEQHAAEVHLEDLDGDCVPLGAIPFRFGYAMTCHAAQGGEWPTVYVSQADLTAFSGYSWHRQEMETLARWAYTAVTRAKHSVRLLTARTFTGEAL